MENLTAAPSTLPPQIPATSDDTAQAPLGQHPDERAPILSLVAAAEAILRQPRRVLFQLRQENHGSLIASLLVISALCSLVYDVVVGTFSGGVQLWAAPVKIAGGLFISALICLPSLYIFSCLSGSQARLVEVAGLVAGLLTLMTVMLVGFAPVAWVFSQSTASVAAMGALHLLFWLVATGFALRFLNAGFLHLRARSGAGIKVWTLILLLVMLQMTTALRPIVGASDKLLTREKKFFPGHWVECLNAADKPGQAVGEVLRK